MHQFICQSCLDLELLLFEGFPLVLWPGRAALWARDSLHTWSPPLLQTPRGGGGGGGGGSAPRHRFLQRTTRRHRDYLIFSIRPS